ncbi:hypothetical protein HBH92_004220 [Parastagonospora nodorum]|nr:hypothetical protein HBH92_004220 [Parastagonospora nodorum]KAH4456193.1 hypothetical protein HBH93_004200 [Parastagonospora nodorum]KAH4468582.1 hypothetical protein HBH91_018400 [Parastagonospora nodorum]KAH4553832.1 hypothetical protein HBH85_011780 [Parastagonospora nodorum]KAH4577929.1 hypothetical protein HBH86_003220 [Parastagonospora nodorum]
MKSLQYLALHGCREVSRKSIKQTNNDKWRIPVVIPPRIVTGTENDTLEAGSECDSSDNDKCFAAKIR